MSQLRSQTGAFLFSLLTDLAGRDSHVHRFRSEMAFVLLMFWTWPPWLVIVLTAVGGEVLASVVGGRS